MGATRRELLAVGGASALAALVLVALVLVALARGALVLVALAGLPGWGRRVGPGADRLVRYLDGPLRCEHPPADRVAAIERELGDAFTDSLRAALVHEREGVRRAAFLLADGRPVLDPSLVPALVEGLRDVRTAPMECDCIPCAAPIAARLLVRVGVQAIPELVGRGLAHPDPEVPAAAALLIGAIGTTDVDALEALEASLAAGGDPCFREAAATSLLVLGRDPGAGFLAGDGAQGRGSACFYRPGDDGDRSPDERARMRIDRHVANPHGLRPDWLRRLVAAGPLPDADGGGTPVRREFDLSPD